jgi:hypothetical protein
LRIKKFTPFEITIDIKKVKTITNPKQYL